MRGDASKPIRNLEVIHIAPSLGFQGIVFTVGYYLLVSFGPFFLATFGQCPVIGWAIASLQILLAVYHESGTITGDRRGGAASKASRAVRSTTP